MTQMEVDVQGAEEIKKMLSQLGLDVKDLKPAMDEVGRDVTKYFGGQVFASRGSVIGQPWQRLSDRYAAAKAKKWGSKPLLVASGRMQKSFRHKAGKMDVTIDNPTPYFKYHQSTDTRYVLPRRAMIGIYGTLQRDATNIIAKVLANKIKQRSR